jgi:hypothetical protein
VKRTIAAVTLCWCMSPSGAWAVDWAINSTLSESVEFNDNLYMRSMLAGGAFGSYSTITTNAIARTSDSEFDFNGSINYRKYFGPGAEGAPTESLAGTMRGHYETKGETPGDSSYLDVSWNRQNTSFALLGELGVTTPVNGDIERTTIGGGIVRSLTNLDTLNLSAHSSFTDYDPAGAGTAFTDTTANATWRHKVSSIASFNVSSDAELLDFSDATSTSANTREWLFRETAGADLTLSPLLSLRGNAGIVYVVVNGTGASSSSILPSSTGSVSSASGSASASGYVANVALTYKMLKNTTLTLSALRTIAPSVIGSLTQTSTLHAGLSQVVDSRSSLSFSSDISQLSYTGTTTELFSVSVAYSYLLTHEWSAQLSYRYLQRLASTGTASSAVTVDPVTGIPIINSTGPASSNSIMLVVSRSVSLLPDGY